MSGSNRLAVRVGGYALATRDHEGSLEILLTRCGPDARFPGQWALPGGGIEWGEHPRDTVVREVAEETSLDSVPGPLLTSYARRVAAKGSFPEGMAIGMIFAARVADGTPVLVENDGTSDLVAWHPMDALPELAWNAEAAVDLVRAGARSPQPADDQPGPGLGIPHRPRSSRRRLGAYAIATNHDADVPRILLVKLAIDDPEAGCWNLPGGGVEPGESPLEALHRECYEETGLALTNVTIHDVDSRVYESWGTMQIKHNVGVIYRGTARGAPEIMETDGSSAEVAWWPFDEAADLPLTMLTRGALAGELLRSAEG